MSETINGGGTRFILGGTVRDHLIAALTAVSADATKSREIVDALDAYLDEGPDRAVQTWENLTPDYHTELEKVRAERDTAIECAQQVVKTMQATIDSLRVGPAATP